MRLRTAVLAVAVLSGWCAVASGAGEADLPRGVRDAIAKAGNAFTDEERLDVLEELRQRGDLGEALTADLDKLIEEVSKYLTNPRLDYFGGRVLKDGRYDFGIAPESPLYPITVIYQARMLLWVTVEYGGYWSHPDRRREQLDKVRALCEEAQGYFPENKLIAMYLGSPVPPRIQYPVDDGAPAWANMQREGIERLADIIVWWVDNRMQENGEYGGGWGDDCEMWRSWAPVLIGFDDPKITAAQARFSRALLSQDHMQSGYTSRMSDVEHTGEDSSDAMTPMMHLEPDNAEWSERALRLADLMENLWTGVNEQGFLQFKSTYFTGDRVDEDPRKACDTVYHPKAMQPTLLYWQRTSDARLGNLFTRWMDTWVDATAREERGKPRGIIPVAIHWPEGYIGGHGEEWWDPKNHTDDPLYVWPSAMPMMTHSLLLTYHMTGDEKYLAPLLSMAKARLDYLKNPPEGQPSPGSTAWCGARLGMMAAVGAKFRLLTDRADFDELLREDASPYVAYRLGLDDRNGKLVKALGNTAAALRFNFEGYTSEVRYTDRVFRFPALFQANGMYPEAKPEIAQPDTQLLYSTVTGDPGDVGFFPMNRVRWMTPPRAFAALVTDAGNTRFSAEVYHFGEEPRALEAELYLLDKGDYVIRIEVDRAPVSESRFTVAGPRTRVQIELPPKQLCAITVAPA